jgi:tetratricopeptide (TPR) repeat protein
MQAQAHEDMANGDYNKAEIIFKKIIGDSINEPDVLLNEKFNLAMSLNRQGKFAEAEPLLQQLLSENGELPTTQLLQNLGIMRLMTEALERQGKHEDAKVMARKGYAVAESMENRTERMAEMREYCNKLSPGLLTV